MSNILIEPQPTDRPKRLRHTLILAVGTFAVGTDAFILAGFLPMLATELQVSTATAGSAITVFALAYALGAPLLATATAHVPRRALLVTALLVLALANLASALAPTFALLLATRIMAALGAAAFTPTAGAVAAALAPAEARARALAVVVGGSTIATALGVPLGSTLEQWFGWRAALAGVAALCALAAAGVAVRVPRLPGGPRVALCTRISVLRTPGVVRILPLTVLGMGAAYVVYAYAVPTLEPLGADPAATLCAYGIGAIAGNLCAGYATDRWGPVRVLTVGYLSMAAAIALLGALAATGIRAPSAVVALAAVWGAASWCQTPAQQHRLIAAAPHESGLVVALNASCIYLGIGLGTATGGLALGHGAAAVLGTGSLAAVAAVLYLRLTA
ncbi:MFS transporter [Nocardia sp. NPDC127579]|uniref:MFS transporter n=1 Tax=Nocardia sp. NPDC127579 TaxID=3345402 RepID=UPI00363472C6